VPLEVQAPASHLPRIPRRDSRTEHEERSVIRPAVFPLQGAVPVQQKSCQHPHFTGSKQPPSISASIFAPEKSRRRAFALHRVKGSEKCGGNRCVRLHGESYYRHRIMLLERHPGGGAGTSPRDFFSSGAWSNFLRLITHTKKMARSGVFFCRDGVCRALHDDPLAPFVAIAVSPVEELHRGEGIPFSPSETVAQSRRAHSRSL